MVKKKSPAKPAPKSPEKKPASAEPTGCCRYSDAFGQMQCESPVTKSYCDSKSGFFTVNGRC